MADILIMEDEPQAALAISDALARVGHRSDITRSCTEALDALDETRYDLLITDICVRRDGSPIPDGGIKLIGRLRQCLNEDDQDWLTDMPILAISGVLQSTIQVDMLSLAQSVGANATLPKPIDFKALVNITEELIAR